MPKGKTKHDLTVLRNKIDKIDKDICKQYEKRMGIVSEVLAEFPADPCR